MEDIFKVIFYAIAIALWIIYKAREQKKSGAWKPGTQVKPILETTVSSDKTTVKTKTAAVPVTKKFKKENYAPKSVPGKSLSGKQISLEQNENVEIYNTPFLNQIFNEDNENEQLFQTDLENSKPTYSFNIQQAILGAEILKRPTW